MTQPPKPTPDPASPPGKSPPRKAPASKDPPLPQALSSPDIVNAITALTTFLHKGSQTCDPQAFSPEQLNIERDFRDLLAGLGRRGSDTPGRIVRPVLSDGLLELGEPLPGEAVSIGGFSRIGPRMHEVWRVKVAEATKKPGDPTHLRHKDIVVDRVVRLRVFDQSDRRILTGVPKTTNTPSRPTP
ncbi:hypothetical protein [Streptomyces canus]|uniref:hypothetical protein n=1 Tax=Streptomyces canus TaxID=58343 RepID=UPI00370FACA7